MVIDARLTTLDTIAGLRERYRADMACQVIHDSIHYRAGWTNEFLLSIDDVGVGYGSVAVAGPWATQHALYEVYVIPEARDRLFALYESLLGACSATHVEVQSNDPLSTILCHAFVPQVESEAILFEDRFTTAIHPAGAQFRRVRPGELPDVPPEQEPWHGVVELHDEVVATGGILFHYNRPYGDIYMQVNEPFRRRGFGAFIVQELKRVARAGGHVPAARTGIGNLASRYTLQKAGFVPCGHLIKGPLHRT